MSLWTQALTNSRMKEAEEIRDKLDQRGAEHLTPHDRGVFEAICYLTLDSDTTFKEILEQDPDEEPEED